MEPMQATLSFEQVLGILRRRAPWVLLCFALVTICAFAYSKHQAKKYTATAAIAFNNNALSQQIAGLSASSSSNLVAQQDSNLELVRLGNVAAITASLLGHGLTADKVTKSVGVGVKGETNIIDVSATSTSPALAATIANTYAHEFVKEQQSANRQFFQSALALVNRQLAQLSKQLTKLRPAQRFGSDGVDLQARAHTLGLLAELGYNNARVAGEASVPSSPSSPKTKRNVLLGGLLGLMVGLGLAALLERLDRRIREPEALEAIYRLPLLGVIPKNPALSRSARQNKGSGVPCVETEAFSLLRAHLRLFNVGREVRTVMIASPAPGDGKTTIALHLAAAAARLGSRVLLLEVDLRHPTLSEQSGIRPGPGLADVLIGAAQINEAIQSVSFIGPQSQGPKGHVLDVLTAGVMLPSNPGQLLDGHSMSTLLERAKSTYELVVIDTPPLTAVSDAFPLLTKVDGVIIVGRLGHSRRDTAERLEQILGGRGAPLVGVIANGAKTGGPAPYPVANGDSSPTASATIGASSSEPMVSTVKT